MRIYDNLLLTAIPLANFAANGAIGTSAATVDIASVFSIAQTTAGVALTLPAPTNTSAGLVIVVNNTGTVAVNVAGQPIPINTNVAFLWNGSAWNVWNGAVTTPSIIAAQADNNVFVNAAGVLTKSPTSMGASFIDVAASSAQFVAATSFTTVVMGTVNVNPNNYYNASTSIYTVPFSGLYQISGTLRVTDFSPAGAQFGVGVHTSNTDGSWFLWHAVQTTIVSYHRTTYPYIRVGYFNAGDQLRMFCYADQVGGLTFSNAGMQIFRLAS